MKTVRDWITEYWVSVIIGSVIIGIGLVVLALLTWLKFIPGEVANLIMVGALLVMTWWYARATRDIAQAAKDQGEYIKRQADASVAMAKEMAETRLQGIMPVLDLSLETSNEEREKLARGQGLRSIQCKLYNIGTGPAFNIEISTVDEHGGEQRRLIGTLGIGQHSVWSLLREEGELGTVPVQLGRLRVTYQDVFSYSYESMKVMLEVPEGERGPLLHFREELHFRTVQKEAS